MEARFEDAFFREVTLRICGSLDIEQALESALDYIRGHLPIDSVGLGYTNINEKRIEVVTRAGRPGVCSLWVEDRNGIRVEGEGLKYIRSERAPSPLLVNRPEDAQPGLLALFPGLRTCSAIFMRLQLSSEDVGALLVWAEGLGRFCDRDARLLASVREPMTIAMVNARRYRELKAVKDALSEDNRALSSDLRRSIGTEVVGADFGLRQVMEQVRQVAASSSPALLLGETGTGKEVIAHAIHAASRRSRGPMISMQCGATPTGLLDSELFGHEKGAFTGAVSRKRGRFERAHGGTLFLDEIGELSPGAQVKLLRVLQEKRFERVGGTQTLKVDVRIIAATHRNLERMVALGTFREDLWYRLNVLPIEIPPLRERPEDIPSLVQYFLARQAQEIKGARSPRVFEQDLRRLQAYHWPGNVRELQNIIERSLLLSGEERLVLPELVLDRNSPNPELQVPKRQSVLTLDETIAAHILSVLEETRWKISGPGGAADLLGINASTLRFRMGKLGISRKRT